MTGGRRSARTRPCRPARRSRYLPRLGLHSPAERQLGGRRQLGQHDRAVPDGRADHRVATAAQRVEQRGEIIGIDNHNLARRLKHRILARMHRGLPRDRRRSVHVKFSLTMGSHGRLGTNVPGRHFARPFCGSHSALTVGRGAPQPRK